VWWLRIIRRQIPLIFVEFQQGFCPGELCRYSGLLPTGRPREQNSILDKEETLLPPQRPDLGRDSIVFLSHGYRGYSPWDEAAGITLCTVHNAYSHVLFPEVATWGAVLLLRSRNCDTPTAPVADNILGPMRRATIHGNSDIPIDRAPAQGELLFQIMNRGKLDECRLLGWYAVWVLSE
jgi:hypothetical protein